MLVVVLPFIHRPIVFNRFTSSTPNVFSTENKFVHLRSHRWTQWYLRIHPAVVDVPIPHNRKVGREDVNVFCRLSVVVRSQRKQECIKNLKRTSANFNIATKLNVSHVHNLLFQNYILQLHAYLQYSDLTFDTVDSDKEVMSSWWVDYLVTKPRCPCKRVHVGRLENFPTNMELRVAHQRRLWNSLWVWCTA